MKQSLDQRANVNARDTQDLGDPQYSFHHPVLRLFLDHSLEITKLLLNRGANVNAQFIDGQTASSIEATCGNARNVGLLLQKGADPNLSGSHPLKEAREYEVERQNGSGKSDFDRARVARIIKMLQAADAK